MISEIPTRELWGRKFNIAQQGLDENQVIEFIDMLIQQRDTLLEQVNSLLSYIRLSKSMVGREEKLTSSSKQLDENETVKIVAEVVQDIQAEMKTTEPEPVTQPVSPEATKAAETGKEDNTFYQGEVELAIQPSINAVELFKFQRMLLDSFQLKILGTNGSPSKGAIVIVLLNEPQPLLQALNQMTQVKEAVEDLSASAEIKGTTPLFKNNQGKRIQITLNKG